MKIETAISRYAPIPQAEKPASGRSGTQASVAAVTPGASAPVTLSGSSIMLSRLFHTEDGGAAAAVPSTDAGIARDQLGKNPVDFLNAEDRSLVADMYAYAQQQGADLVHVDALAITLGSYRQFDDGQRLSGFNGNQFDSAGHQLTSNYSAADTVTANRLLQGDAINSTRLDRGFLQYILQPTHALSNMANLDFMEQMVNRFSDGGSDAMSLDRKFANFTRADSAVSQVVITASTDIVNAPPKTQLANINGHWFILDPALLDDPAALKATGLDSSQLADARRNQGMVALALLDADPNNPNGITAKLIALLGLHADSAEQK